MSVVRPSVCTSVVSPSRIAFAGTTSVPRNTACYVRGLFQLHLTLTWPLMLLLTNIRMYFKCPIFQIAFKPRFIRLILISMLPYHLKDMPFIMQTSLHITFTNLYTISNFQVLLWVHPSNWPCLTMNCESDLTKDIKYTLIATFLSLQLHYVVR